MKTYDKAVGDICKEIGVKFRCFGGGSRKDDWNPIAAALAEKDLQFAAGVDVSEVVRFVLESGYKKGFRQ